MELQSILSLLSDGEFHSGSDLGRALGVSRTAIWKSLGQLEDLGLSIESIKGRGYRLSRPLDLLDQGQIKSLVGESICGMLMMDVLLQIDSTNNYLLSKQCQTQKYHCCLAEHQLSGKGRRGRQWVSPFARNIYLSIAFDLEGGAEVLSGLSLVVGLSVAKTLEAKGVRGVELKWPNDVWLNGKKLGGILVELSGEATTAWRVVLGLGLNINMSDQDAVQIDQPWTDLSSVLNVGRNEVAASLISGLIDDMEVFKRDGFSAFIKDWSRFDALDGKEVIINAGDLAGVARGVDSLGALLLERDNELIPVNAGEVTVRCL
jgi:BirA family biotin operon repressor/biotin-[acetyl-CoA-carboxylase] ligase